MGKKNAGNDTATAKASCYQKGLVKAAFAGLIDEARAVHTLSSGLKNRTNEKVDLEALTLCQGLLRSAEEELHASMSKVGREERLGHLAMEDQGVQELALGGRVLPIKSLYIL